MVEVFGSNIDGDRFRVQSVLFVITQNQSFKSFRHFLSVINCYRRFISNCPELLQPLAELLKKGLHKFFMTPGAKREIRTAKEALSKVSMLAHMSTDDKALLVLRTHAPALAIRPELQQIFNGVGQSLSFF